MSSSTLADVSSTAVIGVDAKIDWRRYRDLIVVTAIRSLKVRYRGSFLGMFWSLSNPLIMTLVYTVVFGSAFKSYYDNSILVYVLACFTGLAFLNFFSGSTSMALVTVVSNGGLLNKLALPPIIFPVATIAAATFQLFMGVLPLLAIVALVVSRDPLNAVAIVVPAVALILLSLGFGLAASAIYVYFRDTSYLYELIVFVMWITSPIFYPPAVVPASVRVYLNFNPLTAIIESARQIVLSGARPSFHLMGAALLSGFVVAAIGSGIFWALRRNFMDLI
jgi:ABC-type polysaccharide/polyol phosphate export permease